MKGIFQVNDREDVFATKVDQHIFNAGQRVAVRDGCIIQGSKIHNPSPLAILLGYYKSWA